MIKTILLILSLSLYQKDIDDLGSKNFKIREDASLFLKKAPWFAIYAMQLPQKTQEGNRRCKILIEDKQNIGIKISDCPDFDYVFGKLKIKPINDEEGSSQYFIIDTTPDFAYKLSLYYRINFVYDSHRLVTKIVFNKIISNYNIPKDLVILYLNYMKYCELETEKDLKKAEFYFKVKGKIQDYIKYNSWLIPLVIELNERIFNNG